MLLWRQFLLWIPPGWALSVLSRRFLRKLISESLLFPKPDRQRKGQESLFRIFPLPEKKKGKVTGCLGIFGGEPEP